MASNCRSRGVFDWNTETTKLLISLYEEHEVLYNNTHPDYKDRNLRLKTLMKISELITQATGKVCLVPDVRRKINSLRSQYLTEKLKISKSKSELDGDAYSPSVYWYPLMKFLDGANSADDSKPNHEDSENSSQMDSVLHNVVEKRRRFKRKIKIFDDDSEFNNTAPDGAAKFRCTAHTTTATSSNSTNIDVFCQFIGAELTSMLESGSMFYVKKAKRDIQKVLFSVWDEIDEGAEHNSGSNISVETKPMKLRSRRTKEVKKKTLVSSKVSSPEQVYLQNWHCDDD